MTGKEYLAYGQRASMSRRRQCTHKRGWAERLTGNAGPRFAGWRSLYGANYRFIPRKVESLQIHTPNYIFIPLHQNKEYESVKLILVGYENVKLV